MTKSRLRERLERLAPIQDIDRVTGSPDVVHLACPDRAGVKSVSAMRVLARRGLSLLKAKRVVEAVLETGMTAARLPQVESRAALTQELQTCGLKAAFAIEDAVDVRALRERLSLTREQFAWRFNLPLDTVEKWETGQREPDQAAINYLRLIEADPLRASEAVTRQYEDA